MILKKFGKRASMMAILCSFCIGNMGALVNAQSELKQSSLILGDSQTVVIDTENNSDSVNILLLKKYLLGMSSNVENADLNIDGYVNVLDLMCLKSSALSEDVPNTDGFVVSEDMSYCTYNGVAYTGLYTDSTDNTYYYTDGSLTTGWLTIDDVTYHFNDNTGIESKGVCLVDGSYYYFDRSTGALVTDSVIGKWVIDSNGIATSKLDSIAETKFNAGYKTANQIYELVRVGGYTNLASGSDIYGNIVGDGTSHLAFVSGSTVPSQISIFGPSASVDATGWATFAQYRALNNKGCCYYMAAYFDFLCRSAGYESRIVYGTQSNNVSHFWNQVNIDGTWLNYDTTSAGRCGLTDQELYDLTTPLGKNFIWDSYIVPDEDYNGCYWYDTPSDYDDNNYVYLAH
ncbi:MAG: hypothetical protein LIO71_08340 [Ruminococcus sp.]|nr:hypothetical protein [Ruminococcus sp.]